MLNFLLDFIPVFLFFLAFKLYGIYAATVVGIVATALQVIITRLTSGRFEKKQVITLIIFTLFGGLTLYFHNPIFVKWKPTIIFWVFSTALLFSRFISRKPLLERLFSGMTAENGLSLPQIIWLRLTYAWIIFFFLLGAVNIYIAYYCSTETWVNFKFYGILGLLLLFSIAQSIYLSRHLTSQK